MSGSDSEQVGFTSAGLPRRPQRESAVSQSAQHPTAYDENTVETAFVQAGFTDTAPVTGQHRIDPTDFAATGRDPKAMRRPEKGGHIKDLAELHAQTKEWNKRPGTISSAPEAGAVAQEWFNVDRPVIGPLGQKAVANMWESKIGYHAPTLKPNNEFAPKPRTNILRLLGNLLRRNS